MNYSLTPKPTAPASRIRYLSSPPEEITVWLGELKLPERLKSSGFDPGRAVSLRCSEVFANPQPSIDVARLAELAPEDIAPDFLHSGSIPINAALLALRFKFFESVEHFEDPAMPTVVSPVTGEPVQEFIPTDPVGQLEEISNDAEMIAPPDTDVPAPALEQEFEKVADAPDIEVTSSPLDLLPPASAAVLPEPPPTALTPQLVSLPAAAVLPPPSPAREPEATDSKSIARPRPTARIPDKRTTFNNLPALRRQNTIPKAAVPAAKEAAEPEAVVPPPEKTEELPKSLEELPAPPVQAEVEEPPKQQDLPDLEAFDDRDLEPAPWEEPLVPPVPAPSAHFAPPPPDVEPPSPTTLHIEHLPPSMLNPTRVVSRELESAPEERLTAQDRLQEIFMTEEQLTLDQVLKLCGGLPGIRSCILTKGSSVLATFNVPDAIDLVSLTGNASAMLDAMRTSSMRMGLGAIPAVTVHSEKGPISFFHSDDLAMLIIHADRGFIPGVREKLHDVVVALGQSNLPLPLGDSSEK